MWKRGRDGSWFGFGFEFEFRIDVELNLERFGFGCRLGNIEKAVWRELIGRIDFKVLQILMIFNLGEFLMGLLIKCDFVLY